MNRKTILTIVILLFGTGLCWYRIHIVWNGNGFSIENVIVALLGFLALLVLSVFQFIQSRSRNLFLLLAVVLAGIVFPLEYVYTWCGFTFNNKPKETLVAQVQHHAYDAALHTVQYQREGLWTVHNGKKVGVYKDSTLLAVFFWQGYWLSKDQYCGLLYISDETKTNDRRIYNFLHRELEYKKLGKNWYWIKCYIDMEPGP